jgi:hypothetical protein
VIDVPKSRSIAIAGGGYLLVEADGKVTGAIAAPWAKDATGRSLPTRYTLEGTTLVQDTDTTGAQFPVVADPRLTYGWSVYLNMWGYELRAWGVTLVGAGGATLVVSCATLGRLPSPLIPIASVICGAVGASLPKVFAAMVDFYQHADIDNNACYQMNLNEVSGIVKVHRSNCNGI